MIRFGILFCIIQNSNNKCHVIRNTLGYRVISIGSHTFHQLVLYYLTQLIVIDRHSLQRVPKTGFGTHSGLLIRTAKKSEKLLFEVTLAYLHIESGKQLVFMSMMPSRPRNSCEVVSIFFDQDPLFFFWRGGLGSKFSRRTSMKNMNFKEYGLLFSHSQRSLQTKILNELPTLTEVRKIFLKKGSKCSVNSVQLLIEA